MIQKIIGRITTKVFPYWCPYCPKRYHKEEKYHRHFLYCEGRKAAMLEEDRIFAEIAPKNRAQRRKMAKNAGLIKSWQDLND